MKTTQVYKWIFIVSMGFFFHQQLFAVDSPLIKAAQTGNSKTIYTLIKKGADINATSNNRETALMIASEKGYYKASKILLAKKAKKDIQDKNGNTALMKACANGHEKVVFLLLNYRSTPDLTLKNKKGETALDIAKKKNHTEIIKLLKKASNTTKKK